MSLKGLLLAKRRTSEHQIMNQNNFSNAGAGGGSVAEPLPYTDEILD